MPSCDDGNMLNGYWWRDETWVPGIITIESHFQPMPKWTRGNATYYSPYTMEATAKYMGFDLSYYVDGVASMSCGDIGATIWIRRLDDIYWTPHHDWPWEGPFLVVDCAEWDDHYAITVGRGEVIELGHKTALRWGLVSESRRGLIHHEYMVRVEVWKSKWYPADGRLQRYIDEWDPYPWFFLDNVEFIPEWQQWLPYKPVFFNDPPRWYLGDGVGFKNYLELEPSPRYWHFRFRFAYDPIF